MKPLSLFLENFGSFYGRHHFPLADRGLVSVLGQNLDDPRSPSNGSGKSTWCDALDWCLFGEDPRKDVAGGVVNEEAGKNCCVTVLIAGDDGQLIKITRLRDYQGHPNGPQIWVNLEPKTPLDASETQRVIEGYLGLDREVFHAVSLFAQTDDFQFSDATDTERKSLLTRIIPELREVDRMADRTAVLFDEAKALATSTQALAATAASSLQTLRGQDPSPSAAHWETERRQQWEQATAAAQTAEQQRQWLLTQDPRPAAAAWEADRAAAAADKTLECDAAVKSSAWADQDHAQADKAWRERPMGPKRSQPAPIPEPVELSRARAAVLDHQKKVQDANAHLAVMRDQFRTGQKALDAIRGKTHGPCSACGQMVTAEHLQREVSQKVAELEALTKRGQDAAILLEVANTDHATAQRAYEGLDNAFRQAQQQHAAQQVVDTAAEAQHAQLVQHLGQVATEKLQRRDELRARVNALAAELNGIRTAVNPHAQAVATWTGSCSSAEWQVSHTSNQVAQIQARVNPYLAQLTAWQASVEKADAEAAARHWDAQSATHRMGCLEFWKTGLGIKGLKSYVLDSKVGEMSAEANRWVQLLTGGTVWVEFQTQREVGSGKKRKMVEDLTLLVHKALPNGTVKTRNYRRWSGGQKYRISLGVDFGLARLVARRARYAYDLLILDEVFKHLDPGGKEAVAELLFTLAQEKSSTFVMDHEASFQNMFSSAMTIRYQHGRSHVVGADVSMLVQHSAFPEAST